MTRTMLSTALIAAAMLATPADAAVITLNFDLTASDFVQDFNPPAAVPVDPVRINFTLTFDPNVDTLDGVTDGLVVNSSNLPGNPALAYTVSYGTLLFGTDLIPYSACTTFNINATAPLLCAFISDFSIGTSAVEYVGVGDNRASWTANQASVTIANAAVPEPASWALMIGGFGLAGTALRRRQRLQFA